MSRFFFQFQFPSAFSTARISYFVFRNYFAEIFAIAKFNYIINFYGSVIFPKSFIIS